MPRNVSLKILLFLLQSFLICSDVHVILGGVYGPLTDLTMVVSISPAHVGNAFERPVPSAA